MIKSTHSGQKLRITEKTLEKLTPENDVLATRDWIKILAAYREPDLTRSIYEIIITVAGFIALWIGAWWAYKISYWLMLLVAIPAGLMLVRLFLIQHDCGHGAFFRSRATNNWVGRILGTVTLTPYAVWQFTHAAHHSSSGNLGRRDLGEIATLTVAEYKNLSPFRKFLYRLYRNPLVMFGLGPSYIFFLQNRLPVGLMRSGKSPWISAMGTNLAIIAIFAAMMWLVGSTTFLMIHIPIVVIAATSGVWLFYIQHQFEDTYWAQEQDWNHQQAAFYGSSHYDLPAILQWATANIGIHHIHHLYSRIPFYRLSHILRDHPELSTVRRLTFWESLDCLRMRLWDENSKQLVSFREARRLAPA